MNYTEQLVKFAHEIKYTKLPASVIERTKLFIADFYAACCAGYKINKDFNEISLEFIKEMEGSNQASILFENIKYPAANAAFINSIYAHGADMDDGNRKAAGHIGTHIIPAVFALGEYYSSTWKDMIVAINVGYEFFNRIAGAAQPSLYNKGFHATGVAGTVACSAACAKLMNLDYNKIYNAVSFGAIQSSGLILIDETGQGCKPVNPANAARTGIMSAIMALKGLNSPCNPLESEKGWFNAFSDNIDEQMLLGNLGRDFTILDSYMKLYPTCRHTHSCIDAAINIRHQIVEKGSINFGNIERIKIATYPNAIRSAGNIKMPKSSDEAKFSIFYAVAVGIFKGKFDLKDLCLKNYNEEINYLISRMELIPDSSMENREEGIRGAKMDVVLKNGKVYNAVVLVPKGEGYEVLDWTDMESKLSICSSNLIDSSASEKLLYNCKNIAPEGRFTSINAMLK